MTFEIFFLYETWFLKLIHNKLSSSFSSSKAWKLFGYSLFPLPDKWQEVVLIKSVIFLRLLVNSVKSYFFIRQSTIEANITVHFVVQNQRNEGSDLIAHKDARAQVIEHNTVRTQVWHFRQDCHTKSTCTPTRSTLTLPVKHDHEPLFIWSEPLTQRRVSNKAKINNLKTLSSLILSLLPAVSVMKTNCSLKHLVQWWCTMNGLLKNHQHLGYKCIDNCNMHHCISYYQLSCNMLTI